MRACRADADHEVIRSSRQQRFVKTGWRGDLSGGDRSRDPVGRTVGDVVADELDASAQLASLSPTHDMTRRCTALRWRSSGTQANWTPIMGILAPIVAGVPTYAVWGCRSGATGWRSPMRRCST
jgi:hypothetical protein